MIKLEAPTSRHEGYEFVSFVIKGEIAIFRYAPNGDCDCFRKAKDGEEFTYGILWLDEFWGFTNHIQGVDFVTRCPEGGQIKQK